MSEAIQLDDYIDEARSDSYPPRKVARKAGGSGGDMDDVLKRLGAVESSLSDLRVQVGGIAAKIPHLATNDGINEVRAVIPHLATKADVLLLKADVVLLKADLYAMETKIIKWMIATVLTAVGLAFTIAKLVH
jgi:hypothetical protein